MKENLQRFLDAQVSVYPQALRELQLGRKQSHWIWFVFPQVQGLGRSSTAEFYAISSVAEAVAYLNHEILGERLRECSQAVLAHEGKDIEAIMGFPDCLKLKSSMTLFDAISPPENIFATVLKLFYGGQFDQVTLQFLREH